MKVPLVRPVFDEEMRGAVCTHSLIVFCLLFLLPFITYRKVAVQYFLALAQHSLISDYLTGGTHNCSGPQPLAGTA